MRARQARDDEFHPAPAVFLVDSDCLPSENLLDNLHCQDVLGRINVEDGGRRSGLGEASESGPAAIVVPCLEFAPGSENSRTEETERAIPLGTQEVAKMLVDGEAQGFHIDYFFKGHGPTDFLRWAAAAREETPEALAYTVPFEPCFEPYVVVNKTVVPMYDERFRGYGMNKVSHLLCLAAGTPGTDTTSAVEPAEFVVLRKGFVFALPHERSPAWEETYGTCRDPLRRYQVKALWSKVQGEIIEGLPPIISSSTAKVAASLHLRPGCGLGRPPLPQPPPHRVCHFVPVAEESADPATVFVRKLDEIFAAPGSECETTEHQLQQRQRAVRQPQAMKEQDARPISSSHQEGKTQPFGGKAKAAVDRSAVRPQTSPAFVEKLQSALDTVAPVTGFGSLASPRHRAR